MIDQAFVDQNIAGWFEPVALTREKYSSWRAAAMQAESELDIDRAFALVHLAFGKPDEKGQHWVEACIKAHDEDFIAHPVDELTARVAALAAIQHLVAEEGSHGELIALLVRSAVFLQLKPVFPDLVDAAASFLRLRANDARDRSPLLPETTAALIVRATEEGTPEGGGLTAEQEIELRDAVIDKLAAHMDALVGRLGARLASQEEEINALWWSYTRRSRDLEIPWSDVEPVERRVVRSAHELAAIAHRPRPSTIGGLLRAPIGTDVDVTIASVAELLQKDSLAPAIDRDDVLLPLTSASRSIANLTTSDDTWKTVVERTIDLDVTLAVTAVGASEQLLREYELAELL